MFNKLETRLMIIIRKRENINKIHTELLERKAGKNYGNFPNLMKTICSQIQEAQQNPSKRKMKKMAQRYIIVTSTKTKA